MAIEYEHRKKIRTNLDRHMKKSRISARQIEKFIRERPDKFDEVKVSADTIDRFRDPDPLSSKAGDDRVLALEKYLEVIKAKSGSRLPRPTYKVNPDSLFFAAQHFFNMRSAKAEQYREAVTGIYSFYAYSEKSGKTQVCRGAIEFKAANPTGSFSVRELQRSIPDGADNPYNEFFSGFFIFREKSLIAMLRDNEEKIPKFYIMSIEPYKDNVKKIVVMRGVLLKTGAQNDVFTGYIYMVRRAAAFDECEMLEPSDVPRGIIAYLDSGEWEAK